MYFNSRGMTRGEALAFSVKSAANAWLNFPLTTKVDPYRLMGQQAIRQLWSQPPKIRKRSMDESISMKVLLGSSYGMLLQTAVVVRREYPQATSWRVVSDRRQGFRWAKRNKLHTATSIG